MKRLGMVLVLVAVGILLPAGHAATFTVVNTNANGAGSLQQAIIDANLTLEPDTIEFNISPGGLQSISVAFDLPLVTSPLFIDGWTQPGFTGQPLIELTGTGFALYGLRFQSHSNILRGLIINNFPGNGVTLESGSSSNLLVGNRIGTDATGKLKRWNSNGVMINGGTNNVVGGTNVQSRNLISGNYNYGVGIYGSGNTVLGNYIGTDVHGTNAIGNGFTTNGIGNFAAGVWVEGTAARGNVIGGTTPGAGNLISGNTRGVALYNGAKTNFVLGNLIGPIAGGGAPMLAAPGTFRQVTGIYVNLSDGNVIGGTIAAARNVVSGNGDPMQGTEGHGIYVRNSLGNIVQGNYIGTDPTGTFSVGNLRSGVNCEFAGDATLIGGTTVGARNVVSGNLGTGVTSWQSSSNVVQGNFIGTKADGTSGLGNGSSGVFVFTGSGNSIGGTTAAAGNVIAWNGYSNATHGVFISESGGTSLGNLIRRNSFFANAQYGIRLFNLGCFTCAPFNDTGDGDSGPNTLLNFPVITNAATSGGSIAISGTYNSAAGTAATIEFFASPEIDPSGFGEGKTYIGSTAVVADGSGNAGFNSFFVDAGYSGQFITATATDNSRNTSEFSAAVAADGPGGVLQFGQPSYSVGESSGFTEIEVVRLGGSTGTVQVNFSSGDGTAISGADYLSVSNTLIFTNGQTSAFIVIQILDDAVNEPAETILLTLDTPTGGAVLGARTNVALTITDNDPIFVSVSDAGVTKPASGTVPMLFPVYLSSASTRTVSVSYATADISAEAGVDYLSVTGRLNFLPGTLTQHVTVTVLSDGLQEGAKSFLLNLSNPSEAIFGDASGLGTIYDGSQGVLQFSATTYSAGESAGMATITVTRTGGALGNVSVPFSATAGTATAGSDFTPVNGVLTFNNGVTSRTFTVTLLNDGASEPAETVQLLLGTPTGTTLGSPSSAMLTIVDDDSPPALAIRLAPGGVALSWPTQATGFQLSSSPVLPTTNWSLVTNAPFVEGTQFVVTNSAVSNRFYRLQQ